MKRDEPAQGLPPFLQGDDSGDADKKTHLQVACEFIPVAAEAMHHGHTRPRRAVLEQLDQAAAAVALVEDQRQLQVRGDLDLAHEPLLLHLPR